jgi:hypothetical protein
MTRLRSRVSAIEEKVARSGGNNAIRLYFVQGYPTDGAEDLLRANGRDLSVPHRIIAFIPAANGAPVMSPLVDVTDRYQRGSPDYKPPNPDEGHPFKPCD